jgi:hypothetical protein
MAETKAAKLNRLVANYVAARSNWTRLCAGGAVPAPDASARWDLVNSQHHLAEFVANELDHA